MPRDVAASPTDPRRVPSAEAGRGEGASDASSFARRDRTAFTLAELLVTVGIILVLAMLFGGALSAARGSQKKQATKALISKLDAIIQQQYATYPSRFVGAGSAASTAATRRQMASGDMPDSWKEVAMLKSGSATLVTSGSTTFPLNGTQRAYVGYYNSLSPTDEFADAECLFMIIMVGGIGDCLDCAGLALSEKGDKDNDKAPEFLDAWGNPIRFVLWPAGLRLPPASEANFFSSSAPFIAGTPAPAPGGVMRPFIFSAGPDGIGSTEVSDASNVAMRLDCGDPAKIPNRGGLPLGDSDSRGDNITNFDAEVGR